jgi:hypothetical protein
MTASRVIALIALALALTMSACGKKGGPAPPGPPDQVNYPRGYPAY